LQVAGLASATPHDTLRGLQRQSLAAPETSFHSAACAGTWSWRMGALAQPCEVASAKWPGQQGWCAVGSQRPGWLCELVDW